MRFDAAVAILGDGALALPGPASRERLVPGHRRSFFDDPVLPEAGGAPPEWKEAAVLVLLYPDSGGAATFPLILRPLGQGHHSGQIALPGGRREGGESFRSCALRECGEELGVDPNSVRVLRELSPLPVPPSRFLVRPFVGSTESKPLWHPSPEEVDSVLEARVSELLDPSFLSEYEAEFDGRPWRIPFFALGGGRVWGATAMILAELAALLLGARSPD